MTIWFTALGLALREIRRNAGRSLLTALGIVIGVGAVIMMVTLGQSATAKVQGDVASLGNNMLIVSPGNMRKGPVSSGAAPLEVADVRAIEADVTGLEAVAPTSSKSELVVLGNRNKTTTVNGSSNELLLARGFKIDAGRTFTDAEQHGSAVCILGSSVKKELFGGSSALEASIRVKNVSCNVIGVLKSKGQSTFGQDQDDFVLMPLTTFQRRISGTKSVDQIIVSVGSTRSTKSVVRQLESLMRERRRIAPGAEDDFEVRDMAEISSALSSVTSTLTALLGGIAAVSLVVGGIGIMNIMLVSVTERTREIGIRLAIGARGGEVLVQFLVEAIVLSALGGLVGIGLGLGGSYAVTRAFHLPFEVSHPVVALAFGFSALVGVAFGWLPARRAAGLNPIEALRYE